MYRLGERSLSLFVFPIVQGHLGKGYGSLPFVNLFFNLKITIVSSFCDRFFEGIKQTFTFKIICLFELIACCIFLI